ncbi:hypothetical protein RJT34_07193 [Clitoria ternatea]|uniref:Uncharacterized protein n=1 Tax=Clitoria ternatea TaxID=43366 RepID=A0AAN9K4U9_CLITE
MMSYCHNTYGYRNTTPTGEIASFPPMKALFKLQQDLAAAQAKNQEATDAKNAVKKGQDDLLAKENELALAQGGRNKDGSSMKLKLLH